LKLILEMGFAMKSKRPRAATLRDVAKLAEVAVSTVSCVLNADSGKYVSEDLRQRVLEAAAALNYRPNFIARSMKGKNRNVLAIVVPQYENVFFTRLINGAEQVAYDEGFMLLFCSTYDDRTREEHFIKNLIAQQVDGFFICPTVTGWENTRAIRERNIPYVVLDRPMLDADQPFDFIGFDNEDGSYRATRYLLELGHRRIAFLNWESRFIHIQQRLAGFWKAIDEAGLDRSEGAVVSRKNPSVEHGYELAQAIFAQSDPTAILVAHHYLAEGLVQFLRETGRRIPEDVSVITYGQPSWVRMNVPGFTCLNPPAHEIGRLGAERLLAKIANPDSPVETTILQPSLIIRQSVKDQRSSG
jgi:DNA-binding LacI/PurR family transcriptional regulator